VNSTLDTLCSLLQQAGQERCPELQWVNHAGNSLHAIIDDDVAFSVPAQDVPDMGMVSEAKRGGGMTPRAMDRLRDRLLAIESRFLDELEMYIVRRDIPQRVRESAYR
jgi:hypothetical protein